MLYSIVFIPNIILPFFTGILTKKIGVQKSLLYTTFILFLGQVFTTVAFFLKNIYSCRHILRAWPSAWRPVKSSLTQMPSVLTFTPFRQKKDGTCVFSIVQRPESWCCALRRRSFALQTKQRVNLEHFLIHQVPPSPNIETSMYMYHMIPLR